MDTKTDPRKRKRSPVWHRFAAGILALPGIFVAWFSVNGMTQAPDYFWTLLCSALLGLSFFATMVSIALRNKTLL